MAATEIHAPGHKGTPWRNLAVGACMNVFQGRYDIDILGSWNIRRVFVALIKYSHHFGAANGGAEDSCA